MRLKSALGLVAPLLASAVVQGCATNPPPQNFGANPTVTAIYGAPVATTAAAGRIAGSEFDTLVYSATEPNRTSPLPGYYGAIRIEFDQPLDGKSISNPNDRPGNPGFEGGATAGGLPLLAPISFCTQTGATDPNHPETGAVVQLIDVGNNNTSIPASVCYDPTSPLGGAPSITIVPGDPTAASSSPTVKNAAFSCSYFTPAAQLQANHQYQIKFDASKIKGTNGGSLQLPSGSGFANGTYSFTTADFTLVGVGFQDANTGYFTMLDKPGKGFVKDLDPVSPDTFALPADDTPLYLFFSGNVKPTSSKDPVVPGITLTRAGQDIGAEAGVDSGEGFLTGTDDVVVIYPAGSQAYWEPGATYTLKIDGAQVVSADTGTALGTSKEYTIKIAAGTQDIRTVSPSNALTAVQAHVTGSIDPTTGTGAAPKPVDLTASDPVDATTATSDNVRILKGSTAVPADVAADGSYIEVTPTTLLDPGTTYTVEAKNLKVAAGATNAGKAIPTFTSTFTTENFHTSTEASSSSSKSLNRPGLATASAPMTSIDRSVAVSPLNLFNGLVVTFNRKVDASTVTTDSVVLSELDASANAKRVPATSYKVEAFEGAGRSFKITVTDPAYTLKFAQRYQVKLTTAIKSADGVALKAEGCSSGDCSDARAFTTTTFAPTVAFRTPSTTSVPPVVPGTFRVTFNFDVDPASVDPYLPAPAGSGTAYRLYKQTGSGAQQQLTPVDITCTTYASSATATTGPRFTQCVPNAALEANTTYLASAVFLRDATSGQSGPARTAATISTHATETSGAAAGVFFGNRTATYTTDCP